MKSKVASTKNKFSWTIPEVLYITTGAGNIFIKKNGCDLILHKVICIYYEQVR